MITDPRENVHTQSHTHTHTLHVYLHIMHMPHTHSLTRALSNVEEVKLTNGNNVLHKNKQRQEV